MAAISKRGKSWVLTWRQNCKQYRKTLGPVSLRDAKLALNAKEVELTTGQKLLPSGLIFSNFVEEYLDWYANAYPNSFYRIEQICKQHLVPFFELYPIDQIRVRDTEQYKTCRLNPTNQTCQKIIDKHGAIKRTKKPIKLTTLNKELRTLKAILNKAHEWEYTQTNPLIKLKYSKELDSKPERFYSKEELELIYQWAPYNWFWWKLLANTGLRRTEALQLKWKNISNDSLKVISTRNERTKSGKWREIPLNNKAKHALERFMKENVSEYVFPRNNARSMTRAFDRVLKRAPIDEPKGSLHSLRHTFCSNLVIAGIPLRTVQKLAGHASFATTEKYAHLSKDHLVNAVRVLDDNDEDD